MINAAASISHDSASVVQDWCCVYAARDGPVECAHRSGTVNAHVLAYAGTRKKNMLPPHAGADMTAGRTWVATRPPDLRLTWVPVMARATGVPPPPHTHTHAHAHARACINVSCAARSARWTGVHFDSSLSHSSMTHHYRRWTGVHFSKCKTFFSPPRKTGVFSLHTCPRVMISFAMLSAPCTEPNSA